MTVLDPVALTRSLVDIDSTTGREGETGRWLAMYLRDCGFQVTEQPVSDGRFNVYAHLGTPPAIVFSTHFDCVPPFFPSREERGAGLRPRLVRREGIIAAQVTAADRLRAAGETRCALLYVVGEERGSDGAGVARISTRPRRALFDQRRAHGQPAWRGHPRPASRASACQGTGGAFVLSELGDSAIDKLLDALMVIRGVTLPDDPLLGRTHYTVGLIEGGVAPNVVSPHASAELLFRTVGEGQSPRGIAWSKAWSASSTCSTSRQCGCIRCRIRDRRLSMHDRRAAAHELGNADSRSVQARSTWPTPTMSTYRSTSFIAVGLYESLARQLLM